MTAKMNTSIAPVRKQVAQGRPSLMSGFYRSAVLRRLALLKDGCITVIDGGESLRFGDPSSTLQTTITVKEQRFWEGAGPGRRQWCWRVLHHELVELRRQR